MKTLIFWWAALLLMILPATAFSSHPFSFNNIHHKAITYLKRLKLPSKIVGNGRFATSVFAENNSVTTYLISENDKKCKCQVCGEVSIPNFCLPFATKFGKVSIGTCEEKGFVIFDRNEEISMGPFGKFQVRIFKKPS
jgi:hypothetical protein